MLKNFWYASEFSSAITSKPKRVTLQGEDFVLYRDSSGRAVALNDRCPHRGAALSGGWVEGDCIRCPYHGWKYQPDGVCAEIPANQPGVAVPKHARTSALPVREKYGFVWLFLGDLPEEQRPPIPPLPEFGDPAWRAVCGEFIWNAHYTRVVENLLDFAHVPIIHPTSFGIKNQPQFEKYDVHLSEWSGSATVTTPAPKPRGIWKYIFKRDGPQPLSTLTFYMPNLSRFEVDFGFRGLKFVVFGSHLPIDAKITVSKWLAFRNFLTAPWADGNTRKRTLNAMQQDRPVVETQLPLTVPYDLAAELHVPSDALQIAYRKLRNKCLDRGWGIDSDFVKSNRPEKLPVFMPSSSC